MNILSKIWKAICSVLCNDAFENEWFSSVCRKNRHVVKKSSPEKDSV